MLKISTETSAAMLVLVLEGSLSGPWVREVESVWLRTTLDRKPGSVRVDLSDVTFVSDEGKRWLEQICVSGAEIVSSDLATKALADELMRKHRRIGNR